MTIFNIPQFSGIDKFSTLKIHDNTNGSGVSARNNAVLTLSNKAQLLGQQNAAFGLTVGDGANITLVNSTLTGNTGKDLQLTFRFVGDEQLADQP